MMRHILNAAVLAASVTLTATAATAQVEVQQVETEGGLTAWLVEEPSIPFVAMELRFRGGTSVDPEGGQGAVNLMTGLLEEGAGDLDARGFAEARDDLAARIDFDAGDDSVSVSAQFLSETTDEALRLVRLALTEPAFSEEAVERVRKQVLSGLRRDAEDPSAIASRAFTRRVYGDHPYAEPGEGTLESVAALDREDLLAAHEAAIVRERAYIAVVGDITAEELAPKLDALLGDLPETGAPLPQAAPLDFDGWVEVVDYDTPQSVIQFGQTGIDRDDPDFFPAFVLNHVVSGGGFQSRLMQEVRVERGLTYGIYAYLAEKDHADVFVGRAATSNVSAGETVQVIRDIWRRTAEEGITEAELDSAKTYLTGAYPLRFDGNATIASILVGMQMDGLSPDYIRSRNDEIEAVTLEDVERVAGRPEGLSAGN